MPRLCHVIMSRRRVMNSENPMGMLEMIRKNDKKRNFEEALDWDQQVEFRGNARKAGFDNVGATQEKSRYGNFDMTVFGIVCTATISVAVISDSSVALPANR